MTELADVLAAIDRNDAGFYSTLTPEERKGVRFFTMNRYISWVDDDDEAMALAVLATNEYFNKNFYQLVDKHPLLMWKLACMTSNPEKSVLKHTWVKHKTHQASVAAKIISKYFPQYSDNELELMVKKNPIDDIIEFLYENGANDTDINKLWTLKT